MSRGTHPSCDQLGEQGPILGPNPIRVHSHTGCNACSQKFTDMERIYSAASDSVWIEVWRCKQFKLCTSQTNYNIEEQQKAQKQPRKRFGLYHQTSGRSSPLAGGTHLPEW